MPGPGPDGGGRFAQRYMWGWHLAQPPRDVTLNRGALTAGGQQRPHGGRGPLAILNFASLHTGGSVAVQESVLALQERLASEQRLVQLIDRIHAAKSLDTIFIEIQSEILTFFDAERMTLYAVDHDKKEIYSKFLALDSVKEIRVPISAKSVAGFVALSRQTVNIADAYDMAELGRVSSELHFDGSFDKRTGFRTTQILCMPVLHEGRVLGVVQILN